MMARYFITLSYDGAAYCGWQRQPDAPTVQQAVEKALSTLLRSDIEVVGVYSDDKAAAEKATKEKKINYGALPGTKPKKRK